LKLYELPRNTKFKIVGDTSNTILRLERIDGMFSVCWDEHGEIVHIAASAEVEIYE
jgi:hypothetical protein